MNKINPASEEDVLEITKNLIVYNNAQVPFTQSPPFIPLNYSIKDNEKIIGGIMAHISCWDLVEIEALWVDESYRGNGLATQLVQLVETEAKKKNCSIAQLDTFDFQAKYLYEKLGYTVFGVVENSPQGHKHYYMMKNL